jgi:hypothetical protein
VAEVGAVRPARKGIDAPADRTAEVIGKLG